MIYELTIPDFGSIDRYFAQYIEKLGKDNQHPAVAAPPIKMVTPRILLINKQIFNECIDILRAQQLTLSHGLLNQKLRAVISTETLRNITHLALSDSGYQGSQYPHSFPGFIRMAASLATALKRRHSLKKFELTFTHPGLKHHIDECWNGTAPGEDCGMRRWTVAICRDLRQIRGIPNVIISGYLPDFLKQDLLQSMTSNLNPLMRIPKELRCRILGMAADWNDASEVLNDFIFEVGEKMIEPDLVPVLTTPTVLLLNRQFTAEALAQLHKKPLTMDCMFDNSRVRPHEDAITKFISPATLQKVSHLNIRFRHWQYTRGYKTLIAVLAAKHSLQTFHFHFEDDCRASLIHTTNHYPDRELGKLLFHLSSLRGIGRVTFSGCLPDCYTSKLKQRMEAAPGTPLFALPALEASYSDGTTFVLPDIGE